MNCIKMGLPGKSILGDYFQENMNSQRPFLSWRISFPGRPIFIQLPPAHRVQAAEPEERRTEEEVRLAQVRHQETRGGRLRPQHQGARQEQGEGRGQEEAGVKRRRAVSAGL